MSAAETEPDPRKRSVTCELIQSKDVSEVSCMKRPLVYAIDADVERTNSGVVSSDLSSGWPVPNPSPPPPRQHAGYWAQHASGSGVSEQGKLQQLQHFGI